MLYVLPSSAVLQRQAVRTSTVKPVTATPVALPTRVRSGLPRPLHDPQRFSSKDDIVEAGNMPLDLGLDPLAVSEPVLTSSERMVLDEKSAEEFFGMPRIGVANTDISFQRHLSALYGHVLGPVCDSSNGGVLLDLCSSWTSHLPAGLQPKQLIGHGMNSEELEANESLSSSFVQNLNNNTRLPLPAASVSAVLCCNGLQYLTRPEWVMAEVRRVLAPGGLVLVSFGDYCWTERATAGWLARKNGKERMQLVARIMESAGLTVLRLVTKEDGNGDGDGDYKAGSLLLNCSTPAAEATAAGVIVTAAAADGVRGDTLFAVIAQKPVAVAVADAKIDPTAIAIASAATGTGSSTDASDMEDGWGEVTMLGADMDPVAVASMYSGPALREMDLWDLDVTPAVLERWRLSYTALVEDAKELGIPASAIPSLSSNTTADEIRSARRHLQSMIASFLSAGL